MNTPSFNLTKSQSKTVMSVLISFVVLALLYFGLAIFTGDFTFFIPHTKPDPTSVNMQKQMSEAVKPVAAQLSGLSSIDGLSQVGTSTYNSCNKGINDIKTHDGYHYECVVKVVYYYAINAEWAVVTAQSAAYLKNQGWFTDSNETTISEKIQRAQNNEIDQNAPLIQYASTITQPAHVLTVFDSTVLNDESSLELLQYEQHSSGRSLDKTYEDYKSFDLKQKLPNILNGSKYVLAAGTEVRYFEN